MGKKEKETVETPVVETPVVDVVVEDVIAVDTPQDPGNNTRAYRG